MCVCVCSVLFCDDSFLIIIHSFWTGICKIVSEGLCVPVSYEVFLTHRYELDMCMHLSVYLCEFGGLLFGSPADKH